MGISFRRVCTACHRAVEWREKPGEEDGIFYHGDDFSPICPDGHVDLEIKVDEVKAC